jgi:hypothetical protein
VNGRRAASDSVARAMAASWKFVTKSDPSRFAPSSPSWPLERLTMQIRQSSIIARKSIELVTWPMTDHAVNKNWLEIRWEDPQTSSPYSPRAILIWFTKI